jgi:hypothetical protein
MNDALIALLSLPFIVLAALIFAVAFCENRKAKSMGDTKTDTAPPRWSTTPPTEPGWYWFRFIGVGGPERMQPESVRLYFEDENTETVSWGEWWPVPLPEPPREEGDR